MRCGFVSMEMPMRRLFLMLCLFLAPVGCQPTATPSAQEIPTQTVSPTNEPPSLIDAERVARGFLEAWRAGNLETMHSLIGFSSQEAEPLPEFEALYTAAHETMTYVSL